MVIVTKARIQDKRHKDQNSSSISLIALLVFSKRWWLPLLTTPSYRKGPELNGNVCTCNVKNLIPPNFLPPPKMGLPSPVREHNEQLPQFDSSDNDSLQYTTEIGGNTSKATYQEVSGAPVEVNSPLGYSVGWVTVVFLNLSKMIGTGVVSTCAYNSTGSG